MRLPLLCKAGVRFAGFRWGLTKILEALADMNDPVRFPFIPASGLMLTSGSDGQHQQQPPSRHYSYEAVDVRSHTFSSDDAKLSFCAALSVRLNSLDPPNRFAVLLEHHGEANEHIHVQVRRGVTFP